MKTEPFGGQKTVRKAMGCLAFAMAALLWLPGCDLDQDRAAEDTHVSSGLPIPHLGAVSIDGKSSDWSAPSTRIEVLHFEGEPPRHADLYPVLSLAWNDTGLLILLTVKDDLAVESNDAKNLWQGDSVELFVAEPLGKTAYQVILAPGRDPAKGRELRSSLHDFRDRSRFPKDLRIDAASNCTSDGYALEILLPWENLNVQPSAGQQLRLQVYVNDRDETNGPRRQARWHPLGDTHRDASHMYELQLSSRAAPPIRAVASGNYGNLAATRIQITAVPELAGQDVLVKEAGRELTSGVLSRTGDWAIGTLTAPLPPVGKPYGPLTVSIAGHPLPDIHLPNADQARRNAFLQAELEVRAVFAGDAFPSVGLKTPGWIETLAGPIEVRTTYYNASYEVVSKPVKPGRYAALVHLKSDLGERTEFLTLYRLAEGMGWREWQAWKWTGVSIDPNPRLGLPTNTLQARGEVAGEFFKRQFAESFNSGTAAAVFLAGVHESSAADPIVDRTSPWSMDARWWFGLRQQLGLVDTRYLTYLPPDYDKDPSRKWPLLIFLHGSGERGDDLERVKVHGPPKLVAQGRAFPFIVISPQCPNGRWWLPAEILNLLDQVMKSCRVDEDRVYLTGLSMGGFGTWSTAMEAPDRFAAIAPICGGGDPRDVERLRGTPTWVFHGGKDPVVPLARSEEMVQALRAKGGVVGLTVYPEAGHDSWTATYDNDAFYQWLLANRRGAKPVAPPAAKPR